MPKGLFVAASDRVAPVCDPVIIDDGTGTQPGNYPIG
ncbi:hypothetical protein FHS96_002865 [Sphingomonas zeicaulis]